MGTPVEYNPGGMTEFGKSNEDTDSDGAWFNAKHQTWAIEVIPGEDVKSAKESHGVRYSDIEGFPYLNASGTELRLLAKGIRFDGEEWLEGYFQVTVKGERLRKIYIKIISGIRAILKVTGNVDDQEKAQVNSVKLEELPRIMLQGEVFQARE